VRRVRFVAAARREYLAEVVYYNKERAGLGARFTAAVEEATARAVAFPLTGSPASKNTRRVFIQGFPFALVYRSTIDGIVVFAVAHHSRRPGYWQSRVQDR
jgi:plasmid stabilization system protein ParE